MARLRHFIAPPGGLRPLAAGLALAAAPALAAPSAVETLDNAVARELNEMGGGIRPVSGESFEPAGASPYAARPLRVPGPSPAARPATGTGPAASQPTAPQRLDMTSNPWQPNGQYPAPSRAGASIPKPLGSSGIQQTSSPYSGAYQPPGNDMYERPESQPPAGSMKSASKKPSLLDRLTGRSAKKTTAAKSTTKKSSSPRKTSTSTASGGGLFDKLFRPFGGEEKSTPLVKEEPPIPPPLRMPPAAPPATFAAEPSPAPRALETPPAKPLGPPIITPMMPAVAGPTAPAAPADASQDPFADSAPSITAAVEPSDEHPLAPEHPLSDDFGDVRGAAAPDDSAVVTGDPEFDDTVQVSEHGAPRPLDPETVETADEFAPAQAQNPPAELPAAQPQQPPAARYAELQRKLAERSGLGGFQGFCPVALRDRRELVDARPEFLSVYKNRTYELSSAEAKARFEADPARYAPVNDGRDAVLTARGEPDAEGSLTHAVWFKDRLYLFRSAETLREFNAEPSKYAVSE